jgi:hypothetical protein
LTSFLFLSYLVSMATTAAPAPVTACIDPDGTPHEHCPLHGCVEYVCCIPAAPALDRALTFALIEVAMVILMGDLRATLTVPQRAAYGREARELLERGVLRARCAVAEFVVAGCTEADAVGRQATFAEHRYLDARCTADRQTAVRARGELAELGYMAAQLAGR